MTLSMGGMEIVFNLWTLAFLFSGVFVIFLLLYIRYLLKQLAEVSEIFIKINNEVISFSSHLKGIGELEMFYGDETLGGLMKHSVHLMDRLDEFGDMIDLAEMSDEELEAIEENDTNDNEEKDQAQALPHQPELFYGGSRRGNS